MSFQEGQCIDWAFGGVVGDELGAGGNPLLRSTPNPLSTSTTISFGLDHARDVELKIFDVNGRQVRSLVDGMLPAGSHRIAWDGLDDSSSPLASGTYFYRLRIDGQMMGTEKAVVLK